MADKGNTQDVAQILKDCRRRLTLLKQERTSWDTHWKELRDTIFPWAGNWLDTDKQNDGQKRVDPIVSAGREALMTLAAGMQGGLTPRSERWFGLAMEHKQQEDPRRKYDQQTEAWLDQCTTLILDILAASNFYHASAQMYEDLGLFGTSVMYVEPDYDTVVTFRHLSVGEYYLADNWKGRADTLFREFQMTARNIVKEFGEENCTDQLKRMADQQPDKLVTLVHAVYPRKGGSETADDPMRMAWASVYFEQDAPEGKVLRISGFKQFPFLVTRWSVHGEDVYGHSPAMYALADIKQAKDMLIDVMDMVGNIARPPLQGPDSLDNTDVVMDPGSLTLIPRGEFATGARIEPIIGYQADAMKVYQVVQEVQNNIRNAFYYQVFMMFTGDESKNMTATEILERKQVRLTQLGPVLERLQTEMFGPLIDIIFDRCNEVGILPMMPDTVEPGDRIDVQYKSALAKASDYSRVTNIQQFLGVCMNLAQIPGMLDNVDIDSTVRTLAAHLDIPPEMLRDQKDVDAMRQQQQQQQQAAEQMAMMQQGAQTMDSAAGAAAKMGSVDMDKNSAYAQLMSALGGAGR
jgi:hypothetical protein